MTPRYSYSILKTIDKNEYMAHEFRNMIEEEVHTLYRNTGHVQPMFAVLYRPPDVETIEYSSKTFFKFTLDFKGFEKLRKFNWASHTPILACMVAFSVITENNLRQKQKIVILTMEDPLFTRYKLFKEEEDPNEPEKMRLVHYVDEMELLSQLPPELKLFGKVIDTGVDIIKQVN